MTVQFDEKPTGGDGLNVREGSSTVRLTIPARPEYIALARLALTGLIRLRPVSEEVLGDLKLALTEACTNSVRHAYGGGEGLVEIVYELCPDRLIVEVSDSGDGFGVDERTPGRREDLTEGGLGITIIRALADQLELSERAGGGSRLRFEKQLGE